MWRRSYSPTLHLGFTVHDVETLCCIDVSIIINIVDPDDLTLHVSSDYLIIRWIDEPELIPYEFRRILPRRKGREKEQA
jgi:hypothetical protein